jgi:hypothetical protein
MRKGQFETYLHRMARLIWEMGLSDPKLFVLSLSLINRLPHLNYGPGLKATYTRVNERDHEWAQQALSFGQLWMKKGTVNGSLPANIYWPKEEYDLGRELARKAWVALYPGKNLLETESAWPPSSAFGSASILNPFNAEQFPPKERDGKTCDLDAIRRYVNQLAQASAMFSDNL